MQVNLYAAKTHLSRLLDQVNASEGIVIARPGRPLARLEPAGETRPKLRFGTLKGEVWIGEDLDEPFPDAPSSFLFNRVLIGSPIPGPEAGDARSDSAPVSDRDLVA